MSRYDSCGFLECSSFRVRMIFTCRLPGASVLIDPRTPNRSSSVTFSKIEPNTAPIRAAIFPDLVPNNIRFVFESPLSHYRQAFGKKRVRAPHIQVRFFLRIFSDGELADFLETHRLVPMQSSVFGSDFSRPVDEAPGRIDENSRECSSQAGELGQNLGAGFTFCSLSISHGSKVKSSSKRPCE